MGFLGWLRRWLCREFGWFCRGTDVTSDPPPAACPIGWQPSVLAPVFYGARDLGEAPVALPFVRPGSDTVFIEPPAPCRIFFPSLDGSVYSAPILAGCGRYPLILFCHGSCPDEKKHYQAWFELPATLARSGYVVLAPQLDGVRGGAPNTEADLTLLERMESWVRTQWEHHGVLMPPPATGVVGHSFGALLAARYALTRGAAAYASLSGVWQGETDKQELRIPKLFTWGEGSVDTFTELIGAEWNAIPTPKHQAQFAGAGHWDYLPAGRTSCEVNRGRCTLVGVLARDLVATFFGKYLPPELWPSLGNDIPDSLIAPERDLTFEQEFYAGSHLMSLGMLEGSSTCRVNLMWETAASSGSTTRP